MLSLGIDSLSREKLMSLTSLTIVVFSKGRKSELQLLLKYLGLFPVRVMILDGTIGGYEDLPIDTRILHLNGDSIAERAQLASKNINTNFSMLLSDDDLVSMTGASLAINFLQKNPEIGCVFSSRNFSSYYLEKKPNFSRYELLSDNPVERLGKWSSSGSEFFWRGVWRSELLSKCLERLGSSLRILGGETAIHGPLLSILGASCSRLKLLEEDLYLSRSFGPPIDASMVEVSSLESKNQLGISDSQMKNYEEFVNFLAKMLSQEIGMTLEDSILKLETTLDSYRKSLIKQKKNSASSEFIARAKGAILFRNAKQLEKGSKDRKVVSNWLYELFIALLYFRHTLLGSRRVIQKGLKKSDYETLSRIGLVADPVLNRKKRYLAIVDTATFLRSLNAKTQF